MGTRIRRLALLRWRGRALLDGRVLAWGPTSASRAIGCSSGSSPSSSRTGAEIVTPPSKRSSFHTTICVLEGLLEFEKAKGATTPVRDARIRGQEYLMGRGLFRSLSTGNVINPDWARFSFPTHWHYDILRGLDYLRRAGVRPDERLAEAVDLVARKRGRTGDGHSRTPTSAGSTSTWRKGQANPAAGTRFAQLGYWTGTQGETDVPIPGTACRPGLPTSVRRHRSHLGRSIKRGIFGRSCTSRGRLAVRAAEMGGAIRCSWSETFPGNGDG